MEKLQAENGYVFAKTDKSAVYNSILYLGRYDSPDNYIQITTAEAEILKAEIEEKLNKEIENGENIL